MRQIRQTLRRHLEAGLSYAQVARAVGIGKGTVGKVVLLARCEREQLQQRVQRRRTMADTSELFKRFIGWKLPEEH